MAADLGIDIFYNMFSSPMIVKILQPEDRINILDFLNKKGYDKVKISELGNIYINPNNKYSKITAALIKPFTNSLIPNTPKVSQDPAEKEIQDFLNSLSIFKK